MTLDPSMSQDTNIDIGETQTSHPHILTLEAPNTIAQHDSNSELLNGAVIQNPLSSYICS
jgi:hypothetical protein